MSLSDWWETDPSQRFWMEITDRPDIGGALRAPKTGADGKPKWHYELVSVTRPGDVVFHWERRGGRPRLGGWSRVLGPLGEVSEKWVPRHGGGDEAEAVSQPNWSMPLGAFHRLDKPITIDELLAIRKAILGLEELLKTTHKSSIYYPFAKYGEAMRANEAYLTKFPVELIPLIETIGSLELEPLTSAGPTEAAGASKPMTGAARTSYMRDTELRLAIEAYSVERVIEYYTGMGAKSIVKVGKPYDLRIDMGADELHVEVKGSSTLADAVFVTAGELAHAADHDPVDLVVIDQVKISRDAEGKPILDGGRLRHWNGWVPGDESLTALQFRHVLPSASLLKAERDL